MHNRLVKKSRCQNGSVYPAFLIYNLISILILIYLITVKIFYSLLRLNFNLGLNSIYNALPMMGNIPMYEVNFRDNKLFVQSRLGASWHDKYIYI